MRRLNAVQPADHHDAGILIPRIVVAVIMLTPYLDPLASAFHAFSANDSDTSAMPALPAPAIKDHDTGDVCDTAISGTSENRPPPLSTDTVC